MKDGVYLNLTGYRGDVIELTWGVIDDIEYLAIRALDVCGYSFDYNVLGLF